MNKTPELGFIFCKSLSLLKNYSPSRYQTTPLERKSSVGGLATKRGLCIPIWFIVSLVLLTLWSSSAGAQSCIDNRQCPATEFCVSGVCACLTQPGQSEVCAPSESCNPGEGCTNLQTDPHNCGYLDLACGPGEQCIDGRCSCGQTTAPAGIAPACGESEACCGSPGQCVPEQECVCGTVSCADGQICCSDPVTGSPTCVPAGRDEDNCGSCGACCEAGQDCLDGSCVCESGVADCDGDPGTGCEADLSMDIRNCGACGVVCRAGEICDDGQCKLTCQPGYTNCSGECVDLSQNTGHCGGCFVPCGPGRVCDGGGSCELTCQVGLTKCSLWGSGWPGTDKCVDLDSDRNHCGGCGVPCDPGEVCDGSGQCVLTCQPELTECDGVCRDLLSDRSNCGGCGVQCGFGEVCDGGGSCQLTCQSGLTQCDGVCRDLSINPQHCGTCGNECLAGEICVAGYCKPMGISALDAAPNLFIPYWSTIGEDTLLVLNSSVDAFVLIQFFDKNGQDMQTINGHLRADEHLTLDLFDEGIKGEGSIVIRSKPDGTSVAPSVAAETIIRGGRRDEIYSFSPVIAAKPANTSKRVWTTFAQAWYGSFGSLDDELFIFAPTSDLAAMLDNFAILPGQPEDGFPFRVMVELYDDAGTMLINQEMAVDSAMRIDLLTIPGVQATGYSGPGTIRIQPVLVYPDCKLPTDCKPIPPPPKPEDVVFVAYLKRHMFNEVKADKDAVKSGYLFSVEPEKRGLP